MRIISAGNTDSGHVSIALQCTDVEYCITAIVWLKNISSGFHQHRSFENIVHPNWLQQSRVTFRTMHKSGTVVDTEINCWSTEACVNRSLLEAFYYHVLLCNLCIKWKFSGSIFAECQSWCYQWQLESNWGPSVTDCHLEWTEVLDKKSYVWLRFTNYWTIFNNFMIKNFTGNTKH